MTLNILREQRGALFTGPQPMPERLLLIEPGPMLPPLLSHVPQHVAVIITRYAMLDAAMIARVAPDCIAAPLMGDGFDIMELAQFLSGLGYANRLCILAPPLPNPGLILREVSAVAAALHPTLVMVDGGGVRTVSR